MKRKTARILVAIAGIVVSLTAVLFTWNQEEWKRSEDLPPQEILCRMLEEERCSPHITVEGATLGGLDRNQLRAVLNRKAEAVLNTKIQLNGRRNSYIYTLAQLGLRPEVEKLAEEIWMIGREGTLQDRMKEIAEEKDFSLSYSIETEQMRQKLQEVSREEGIWLDIEQAEKMVYEKINALEGGQIKMPRMEIVDAAQVMEPNVLKNILGTYQTSYDPQQEGRSVNLALAAEKINGTVLMPGEEFSFNRAVGPITEQEGYREGNVLIDGKYVPGIGGGICQISTTLYVAVLKAELKVSERHNHGFPASYTPEGLDAAVAVEAGLDFRFKNDSAFPVCIWAYAEGGHVEVRIYGTERRGEDRRISFRTERVSYDVKPDPIVYKDATQPAGYKEIIVNGHQGGVVDTIKIIEEGGRRREEVIDSSRYRSSADQICIGTGEK